MSMLEVASLKKANPGYIRKSMYGPATESGLPAMRASDLPGMVALPVQALFPDIPKAIYVEGDDLAPIRRATAEALAIGLAAVCVWLASRAFLKENA